jgi:DNA modification methylase
VLGGNMRLRAFRERGITDVVVSVVDAPTEEMKIKYALSDNDQVGKTEKDQILALIEQYPNIELNNYAIHLEEPETLKDFMDQFKEVEEDEVPEVPTEAISKLGEVYQLGKHKIMCGSATDEEDVAKLMGGVKADMVFTDPPYNVNYEGKTEDKLKIENDIQSPEDFHNFLYLAFSLLRENSKAGASIYVCHSDTERVNFTDAFREAGWKLAEVIIWVKQQFVMGRQDYQWQHEPILYGWQEGHAHYFNGGRTQTTVWNIDRPLASRDHPTMKPLALVARALTNNSKSDDIILDTFGGSGSTLIACEQANRVCYMMELDPKYLDVIRRRYWKFINNDDEKGWEDKTPEIK